MKKKLFSLMMTLVLAFMGVAQAEVVTIGSGTETSTRLPGYTYYKYASSQQLYTPAEIGSAGTINSIAFFNDGESRTRTIDLYLVNTSKTAFNSSIDWIQPTTADQVFTGSVTFTPGTWTTITLTTPFDYDGTSNLAVIYVDHTGSYLSGTQMACRVYQGAENSAMWKYQDSVYDPFTAVASGMNSSSASAEAKIKNQIQLDITRTGGGGGATYDDKLHVKYEDPVNGEIIDSLNLGVRPIGAWMAPFEFVMYSEGPVYQVNVLDFTPTDGLFSIVDQEMPYEVAPGADVDLLMSTNGTAAGVVERQFVAITELVREAHIWPVVVEFYSPEVPDVWEKACPDVPANVPYATAFIEKPELVHGTTLHNDYTLPFPEVPEGYDAVYKLQYNKDVVLNARVSSGADGKVALYAQDFNGEGGPMADNYYYGPIIPSQGRINRANMTFDFEEGSLPAGWTCEGDGSWTVGTGDHSSSTGAHGGTYNAKCTHVYEGDETYLVTNPMNFSGVTSGTINCYFVNRSWYGDTDEFGVYYRTNGGPWNELYYTTATHSTWTEMGEIALTGFGANYQIGFLYVDNYGYGVGLDDITITTTSGGGGGGGGEFIPGEGGGMATITYGYGPEISDMPVEKGTYYLVASSTESDFEVTIDAAPMPCPSVEENEVFSFNPSPADNADSIQPASVNLSWTIPTYATQWRIIVGSTYHPELNHPQTIYYPHDANGGWGWSTELASSFTIPEPLWNNTNYFWRVEFRNDGACTEGVSSPVWGFTTTLNIPQNLQVSDENIFDDETVTLTWDQVVDRTYRKYFIYRNFAEPSNSADVFERIGETEIHHIDSTRFVDGPLPYNMEPGYTYYVTAVYDEGESYFSNPAFVKVSGYGMVSGHVYEIDGTTGIPGATVTLEGEDEFGDSHTYNFVTDENGFYQDSLYVGVYDAVATCPGYQPVAEPLCGNPVTIIYDNTTTPVDFIMDENFYGPCGVRAEYYPDVTDPNSEYVKVYWGCGLPVAPIIEDFETGNFNAYGWVNGTTNPWTIETTNVHAGAYSMKSGGAGVNSSESVISVEIEVPEDGLVSFYGKISSESGYDYGNFYLDNTRKTHISGNIDWTLYEYPVTAGTHTFKWTYTKDVSQAAGDDCFYVDDITFFRQPSSEDTRALNHYRVYRTNCYQDSPYTEENTVLLATVWVPDTVYIDVEWADLEPGVYKWGVGAVYVGIRSGEEIESPITWTEPIAVNNTEVTANRDVIMFQGFEDNDMAGWEMVDCNPQSGPSTAQAYDGDYSFRFHWTNSSYPLPHYLVSPVLPDYTGGLDISLWYARFSTTFDEETFEVGYSTTTNAISAFTFGPEVTADYGWSEYTSTFPAGTKYVAIKYTGDDQFYLYIDNITLSGGGSGGSTPGSGSMDNPYAAGTEPIQLERESILMWSNCLDKDMYLSQVDVNVELNSADNAFGTTVTLTNLNEIEQGQYAIDPVVLDSSEFYAWESFRRGRYAIEVEKDGYYTIYDTVRIWDEPTHLRYVMTEILYGVGDIYVSRTGWASWGDYVAPEPTPGPGPEPGPGGETITDSFEDYTAYAVDPTDGFWTFYDGDGVQTYGFSGISFPNAYYTGAGIIMNTVEVPALATNYAAHSGDQYVAMFNATSGTTNDWMISGELSNPGSLSFWAREIVDTYGPEVMKVWYSTTTNDPSAFQLIQQESVGVTEWTEYTYTLPAGTKYVAINCASNDVFALLIDDVTIGTPATRNDDRHLEYYKVMCESIDHEPIFNIDVPYYQPFCQVNDAELEDGEHYICKVAAVYSTGISEWTECEWQFKSCDHYASIIEQDDVTYDGTVISWGDVPGPGPGPGPGGETITDGFEDYTAFEVDPTDGFWTFYDGDGVQTYGFSGITFPNAYYTGAGIIMNTVEVPALATNYAAHSGDQYVAMFNATSGTTNDWMISGELSNPGSLSFWAREIVDTYGPEVMKVWYSTTTNDPSAFQLIQQESVGVTEWTEYTYTLPAGTKYVAINCASNDVFALLIDDVTITAGSTTRADGDVLGIMVFVDGQYEAFVPAPGTSYNYTGDGEVTLRTVYDGTQNLPTGNIYYSMSCPVVVNTTPEPVTCEAGEAIHAEALGATDQVMIWWGEAPLPPGASGWMTYGVDEPEEDQITVVGAGTGASISCAMMIPAEELGEYVGSSLTKVRFYQVDESQFSGAVQHDTYTANVYVGGTTEPGTLVSSKDFVVTSDAFAWIDVELDDAVLLDGTQNVWVAFHCDCTTASRPFAGMDDVAGTVNCRWIEYQGQWLDLANAGVSGTMWLIQAYADGGTRNSERLIALNGDQNAVAPAYNGHITLGVAESNAPAMRDAQIVKYNVYRSADPETGYTLIAEVPAVEGQTYYEYIDTPEATGMYFYQVTAVYDNECESDPAMSGDNEALNYVQAEVTSLGENNDKVALYPNPTKGNVTIEANGMSRITVVSVLGQVVFDTELDDDSYILNMAQFNAGMYMVRVNTEDGVVVKRVTVMQ